MTTFPERRFIVASLLEITSIFSKQIRRRFAPWNYKHLFRSRFVVALLVGMTSVCSDDRHFLDGFAAEEIDEFDDQDYDDHQFEDESAALVELVDHEAVEVFGGFEF